MPRTRPPYPAEFRHALEDLARAGRTPEELSRVFGPSAKTIRNWLRQNEPFKAQRGDHMHTADAVGMKTGRAFDALAPNDGLSCPNGVWVAPPAFLSRDASPLLLFDHIVIDKSVWKRATADHGLIMDRLIRDLKGTGVLRVQSLITQKTSFAYAVEDICALWKQTRPDVYPDALDGSGARTELAAELFQRWGKGNKGYSGEDFELLLDTHVALQASASQKMPIVTCDQRFEAACSTLLRHAAVSRLLGTMAQECLDALHKMHSIYSPSIPLLLDKRGQPYHYGSFDLEALAEVRLLKKSEGHTPIEIDPDASLRQLERLLKLRGSSAAKSFREHMRDIEAEARNLPPLEAREHFKRLHRRELAKVQAALLSEAPWANTASRILTYLSVPIAVGGLFDPLSGLIGVGLAAGSIALSKLNKETLKKQLESARESPMKDIQWYLYYQDLLTLIPKRGLVDRLKAVRRT